MNTSVPGRPRCSPVATPAPGSSGQIAELIGRQPALHLPRPLRSSPPSAADQRGAE